MAEDVSDADSYRRWVLRFASALVWFGVFIGGGALWFYLYKILTPETPGVEFLFKTGLKSLPILLFTSIGLFTITLMIGRIGKLGGKLLVLLLGLFEVMTLTFFAVTRQLIQNGQLSGYLNLKAIPTNLQASPLIAFLITFVFGLGMILWMIHAMAKTAKK